MKLDLTYTSNASKVGRSNIDFLSRMEGDVADAGDDAKWEVVRAIGEESLEIVPGSVVDDEAKRVERLKRLKANGGIADISRTNCKRPSPEHELRLYEIRKLYNMCYIKSAIVDLQ